MTADRVATARNALLAQIQQADSLEPVSAAIAATRAWLDERPDDEAMWRAGAHLASVAVEYGILWCFADAYPIPYCAHGAQE